VLTNLEAWIRRRLRAYLWRSGRTGTTVSTNCADAAYQVQCSGRRRFTDRVLAHVRTPGRFNKHCAPLLRLTRLSPTSCSLTKLNQSNRRVRDPYGGAVSWRCRTAATNPALVGPGTGQHFTPPEGHYAYYGIAETFVPCKRSIGRSNATGTNAVQPERPGDHVGHDPPDQTAATDLATKLYLPIEVTSSRSAVNHLLKSVVREICTLRSVGTGAGDASGDPVGDTEVSPYPINRRILVVRARPGRGRGPPNVAFVCGLPTSPWNKQGAGPWVA